MKKRTGPALTRKAMQAMTEAVAKVVEDHRQRGLPLAVWRDGRAVSIPASDAHALREFQPPYRTRRAGETTS
ncbi:MAG: hypothetical protein ACLQVX_16120 [Limisphaerales bacterium]